MADAGAAFDQAKAVCKIVEAAARAHNVVKLKQMVASGFDLDAKDGFGEPALVTLCAEGCLEAVRALLEAGADANAASALGMTPLGQALGLPSPDLAALLLKRGADPDLLIDVNIAPLTIAISSGDAGMTRLLLDHKASLTLREPCSDPPPVVLAAEEGNLDILRMLHEEYGADINVAFKGDGGTALMAAIEKRQHPCFHYLLDKGADIHLLNRQGQSLIHIAAEADNGQAVAELIRRGLSVDQGTPVTGMTPLMSAASEGCLEAASVLLDHDADIEAQTRSGATARMMAESKGHRQIVDLLDGVRQKRHLAAVSKDVQVAHLGVPAEITVQRPLRLLKRRPD